MIHDDDDEVDTMNNTAGGDSITQTDHKGSSPLSIRVNTILIHQPSTQEELMSSSVGETLLYPLCMRSMSRDRTGQLQRLREMIHRQALFTAAHMNTAITDDVISRIQPELNQTLQELNCLDCCSVRPVRRQGPWMSRVSRQLKVTGQSVNGADIGRISSKLGIHPNRDEKSVVECSTDYKGHTSVDLSASYVRDY